MAIDKTQEGEILALQRHATSACNQLYWAMPLDSSKIPFPPSIWRMESRLTEGIYSGFEKSLIVALGLADLGISQMSHRTNDNPLNNFLLQYALGAGASRGLTAVTGAYRIPEIKPKFEKTDYSEETLQAAVENAAVPPLHVIIMSEILVRAGEYAAVRQVLSYLRDIDPEVSLD